jgi:hypothetical protein
MSSIVFFYRPIVNNTALAGRVIVDWAKRKALRGLLEQQNPRAAILQAGGVAFPNPTTN